MRLVDREKRDVGYLQQSGKALCRRPLRRDVEQVQLPVPKRIADGARVFAGAGQGGRFDPEAFGAPHLVLHQRDQGRDDDRRAMPRQRRQLVAERLAGTGRHDRQRMLAANGAFHHLLLHAAKMGKAETLVEKLMHAGHSRTIAALSSTRKLAR